MGSQQHLKTSFREHLGDQKAENLLSENLLAVKWFLMNQLGQAPQTSGAEYDVFLPSYVLDRCLGVFRCAVISRIEPLPELGVRLDWVIGL